MKIVRALVLMSGGLDSILAVKVLEEQGVEVTALTFESNFFEASGVRKLAEELNINLLVHNFSEVYLEMLKNPKYGYGKNMNPCIDCHGLMMRTAYRIMKEAKFDFIASGEVLGQRPKSQNRQALSLVENYGELDGYLLRPLSAKLLPETKMEKDGLVDRSRLLGIEGRRREAQIALAKKYNIKNYPSPGGGCILTYSEFSKKLKRMLEEWPDCNKNDIALLRAGRIFWFNNILIVVGRDKEDNKKIEKLVQEDDLFFELKEKNGPVVLLRDRKKTKYKKYDKLEVDVPGELDTDKSLKDKDDVVKMAMIMTGYFSPKLRGKKVEIITNIINN